MNIQGKNIVFTGKFKVVNPATGKDYTRKQIEEKVRSMGAYTSSKVDWNTDILVTGPVKGGIAGNGKVSRKMIAAMENGVQTFTFDEFVALTGIGRIEITELNLRVLIVTIG